MQVSQDELRKQRKENEREKQDMRTLHVRKEVNPDDKCAGLLISKVYSKDYLVA